MVHSFTNLVSLRLSAAMVVMGFWFGFATSPLPAAEVLDQQYSFPTGLGDTASLFSQEIGQTFTVGVAGTLSRIEVLMARIGADDNAVLTVYNTTGGLPNTPLGTTLVHSSSIVGTSFVPFDFSSFNIPMNVGDVFAFGMSSSGGGLYVLPYDNTPGYSGGVRVRRTLGMPPGPWSSPSGHDHGFKTYMNVAIVGDLPGDYNGNSVIDAADYTVWRDTMTAGSSVLLNDSTPGTVDDSDFDYWRIHFGEALGSGAGTAAATIPEPASIALALVAMLGVAALARRRD